MATAPQQGIMALPQDGGQPAPQQPSLSLDDSYDAVRQGLQETSPIASQHLQEAMSAIVPNLDQMDDQQLDALLYIVRAMHDHPELYKELVQKVVDNGIVDEGDFPEEYDPEFLAALGSLMLEARRTRKPEQAAPMQPPMQLAKGGIAEAVRKVAAQGRGGDTMLAHINPEEAALLKAHGGSGTINPVTGLREYKNLLKKAVSVVASPVKAVVKGGADIVKGGVNAAVDVVKGGVDTAIDVLKPVASAAKSVLKPVVSAAKDILASPVGKILATAALATFLGPGALGITGLELGVAALPLAAGTVTALSGGNTKDILKSAAIAYLAAPGGAVSNYVNGLGIPTSMGITSAAGAAAVNAGLIGTGAGLLTGQNLKESLKTGLVTGAAAAAMTAAKGAPTAEGAPQGEGTTTETGTQGKVPGEAPVPGQEGAPQGEVAKPLTPQDVQNQINEPSKYALQPPPTAGLGFKSAPITDVSIGYGNNGLNPVDYSLSPTIAPTGVSTATGTGLQVPTAITAQPGWNLGLSDAVQNPVDYSARIDAAANGPIKGTSSGSGSGGGKTGIPAPTIGESLSTTWEGIKNGDLSQVGQGLGDLFMPSGDAGVLRTYGPAVGAGLLATGAMGGFQPSTLPSSGLANDMATGKTTADIIAGNPKKYIVQGLSGVQYDANGNIIGSSPWTPGTQGNIEQAATNYVPYAPSVYSTPIGAMDSQGKVPQPYNTSAMYTNIMRPRYAADGGFMQSPTFPGTPLTMDSGPMMAQQAHPLDMNTPGVPMNRPMGFAAGGMPPVGIASLAPGGYPRRNGQISGPGTETSDDIPAMLSDGEFVMTAKAVRGLGKGSRREGAKKMYALMHRLEKNAARG